MDLALASVFGELLLSCSKIPGESAEMDFLLELLAVQQARIRTRTCWEMVVSSPLSRLMAFDGIQGEGIRSVWLNFCSASEMPRPA